MTETKKPVVRFLEEDQMALWRKGDLADDLGEEFPPEAPDFLRLHLLRLHRTGEVISLTDPYGRGLIEQVTE